MNLSLCDPARDLHDRASVGPQAIALFPDPMQARIGRAVAYICRHFARSIAVAELADIAALSKSAFHRQFKAATGLSPVQFQKRLRLLRARSALISAVGSVAEAGHAAGYDSVAQFTRDYARFFGLPPAKDRNRIRRALLGA
jgi:transcriptional regulator GlxA family with amidase domain